MRCWILLPVLFACLSFAQQDSPPDQQADQSAEPSQAPSRSNTEKARARDTEAGESSSRDTRIDLSPPKDDAKNHPNGGQLPSEDNSPAADTTDDVQELHPWNPYRAVKDDEVGDFYFKRKNYKAALARYQDALDFKENDAVATFRLAQCFEKLDQPDQAINHYRQYLKILPEGPFAKEARKSLEKLGAPGKSETSQTQPNR